jgi:RecA-family ATPase
MATQIPDHPVDRVNYALETHGLKIFPIKSFGTKDYKSGGLMDKTPAMAGWGQWAEKATKTKVKEYAKTNKASNWAVHTGASGIVIIDVDVKGGKDGVESMNRLCTANSEKIDTLTVKTPSGGFHYYYKLPEGESITGGNNKLGVGVDIQAGGKYALLYGSKIESGKTKDGKEQIGGSYNVVSESDDIKLLPAWLLKEMQKQTSEQPINSTGKVSTPKIEGVDSEENIETAIQWLKNEAPPCVYGGDPGGEYMLQIFFRLRDMGLSKTTARDLFFDNYIERCEAPPHADPAQTQRYVEAKLNNAYKYARNENIGAKTPEAQLIEARDEFGITPAEEKTSEFQSLVVSDFNGIPPRREWLIHEWLPLNEISSLYGAGGAGKSLLALQMAISIATGTPFLGLQTVLSIPALVVFCEDSKDELHRRVNAIKSAPEYDFVDQSEYDQVRLWPRVGMVNDIARASIAGNDIVDGPFKAVLEKELSLMPKGNKLLILDTLSDVYLGDENTREKVNKFVKTHLGGLIVKHNLTILILAHPSRTGVNTKDLLSGSTAWNNSVRNRLTLSTHKKDPDKMVLNRIKSNYAKSGEEILLRWYNGRFELVNPDSDEIVSTKGDTLDLARLIAIKFPPTEAYPISTVAKALLRDPESVHLFGAISDETLTRKLIRAYKTSLNFEGVVYYYTEGEIPGKRGKRWLVVRNQEENEKAIADNAKEIGAEDLIAEEKRLVEEDKIAKQFKEMGLL